MHPAAAVRHRWRLARVPAPRSGSASRAEVHGYFPLIVETLARLRSRSCIIDGEAVVCDDNGVASFDRICHGRHDGDAFLYAFDLIELNGDDLRRDPLEVRKATLASMWPRSDPASGSTSISRATAQPSSPMPASLASKAIVSKRKDSAYRSGCSPEWLK